MMENKDNPLRIEYELACKIGDKYGFEYMPFSEKYCPVDGILFTRHERGTSPNCLFEIKCRLDEKYNSKELKKRGAMVTKHKFDTGITLSKLFGLPFVIFYYFPKEDKCYSWRVTNDFGSILIPYKEKKYKTQKNMENPEERVERDNVLLFFADGKELW